jgi:hypothetical protein
MCGDDDTSSSVGSTLFESLCFVVCSAAEGSCSQFTLKQTKYRFFVYRSQLISIKHAMGFRQTVATQSLARLPRVRWADISNLTVVPNTYRPQAASTISSSSTSCFPQLEMTAHGTGTVTTAQRSNFHRTASCFCSGGTPFESSLRYGLY